MIIYRMTDRVTLNIKGLVFKLAPLSFDQKVKLSSSVNNSETIKLAIKHSVKSIEGLETIDGKPYDLQFANDELTDTCIDELLNLPISAELSLSCMALINGVKEEIVHPTTGKKIEGVTIVNPQIAQIK